MTTEAAVAAVAAVEVAAAMAAGSERNGGKQCVTGSSCSCNHSWR